MIGFDDAPFPHAHRGDVRLVGTVCARTRLDGVLSSKIRRDGANAAARMAEMIAALRTRYDQIIIDAYQRGASDIHVETFEPPHPVRVRLRVDGELRRHLDLPARVRFAIVARLKKLRCQGGVIRCQSAWRAWA